LNESTEAMTRRCASANALAHRLVMASVDSFNGYGDQGPDFRL